MDKAGVPQDLPRVVYIMGTARSGSTILEILLGNGKGVFGAGELTSIVNDGFLNNADCSCTRKTENCQIWGAVKNSMGFDVNQFQHFNKLQKKVDWHDGFVRQLLGLITRGDAKKYADFNSKMLAIVKTVSGADIVVDSSKYAGRALALRSYANLDVTVVCLTRSPKGLMSSFQKENKDEQRPKSAFKTLAYYLVTMTSLRIASWRLSGKTVEVKYEDLLLNPISVLKRIETFCRIDLTETKSRIQGDDDFDVGHVVTGNRLRKTGEVKFWASTIDSNELGFTRKLALPLMYFWRWGLRF